MIKKPTADTTIEFESNVSVHKLKATLLAHLYGEAMATARKLTNTPANETPRTMIIYDQFRHKIADHLTISFDDLAEETVHLLVQEMETKIADLKKTCTVTADLQS